MKHTAAATFPAVLAAIGSLDAYNPRMIRKVSLTFTTFRNGYGARAVHEMLDMDLGSLATWQDFKARIVSHFDGIEGFRTYVQDRFPHGSTAQKAIAIALLKCMGSRALASRLADEAGMTFGAMRASLAGEYRLAVDCALSQIDSDLDVVLEDAARALFEDHGIQIAGQSVSYRELKKLAKAVGGVTVSIEGEDCLLTAPQGFHWSDGMHQWESIGCFYNDLANRLADAGLEDCTDPDCGWCHPSDD